MNNSSINILNNKIIFLGVILAIILHGLLIPISSLIKINKVEEVEPKIILELISENNEKPKPIRNKIKSPVVSKPKNVIKPPTISPPQKVKLKPIERAIIPTNLSEDIILPNNLKPILNNKIDIPKRVDNIDSEITIRNLPNIIKPDQIKSIDIPKRINNIDNEIILKNLPNIIKPDQIKSIVKPTKKLNKPNLNFSTELSKPTKLKNSQLSQIKNLTIKPIKEDQTTLYDSIENVKKNDIMEDQISTIDISNLNNYKNNIRSIIQTFAIQNYPKKDLRRKNEGIVHLIFKLNVDGSIDYVKEGPNTKATPSLIKAAINSVYKSAPFEQIKLLSKKNEFELNIIYKIK
jgi:outer membrane biosynthesis protein TonB